MRRFGLAALAAAGALVMPALVRAHPPPRGNSDWIAQADAACAATAGERDRVITAVRSHPSRTVRLSLLRILAGTNRAETPLLDELSSLRPKGRAAGMFRQALAAFRSRHAADVRLVGRLRRRWNSRLLEHQARGDSVENARIARLWTRAGATQCAAYFRALRT
jgi:hypothetical protein